jgi:methyl-accepting chemotaxis protein
MEMSIKIQLILFSIVSLLFVLIVGGVGFYSEHQMSLALQSNTTASAAMRNHMEADMMHDALRADVLASALAAATKQVEQRKAIEKDTNEHLQLFRKALQENEALALSPEIINAMKVVRPLVETYLADSQALVTTAFTKPEELATKLPKYITSFETLEVKMSELSDLIEKNANETDRAAQANSEYFERLVIGAVLIAAISLLLLAAFVITRISNNIHAVFDAVDHLNTGTGDLSYRLPTLGGEFRALGSSLNQFLSTIGNIIQDVGGASDSIASAAGQIASGNQDLAQRTVAQASSLDETASSMEELIATVNQNADNARQASSMASSASDVASKGGAVVARVIETMSSINESSKKIVDIISVIDGIAFQTNILALNAAVEAARAGEQGRGFAVVAAEVRNLAQRSASAAKEIKTLISDSVEKVDAGAKLVDQAGATMNEVVASVRGVTSIISEITTASHEQTQGLDLINQAISRLDQSTQQNAALVEESAAAAAALQEQAEKLTETVSVFKLGGGKGHRAAFVPETTVGRRQMQQALALA